MEWPGTSHPSIPLGPPIVVVHTSAPPRSDLVCEGSGTNSAGRSLARPPQSVGLAKASLHLLGVLGLGNFKHFAATHGTQQTLWHFVGPLLCPR